MNNDEGKNNLRKYLVKKGLDFSLYGSNLIKEYIQMLMVEPDLIYNESVYTRLAHLHNRGIETIKKCVRDSINDLCKRGIIYCEKSNRNLSTKKAIIEIYNDYCEKCGIYA